MIPLRNWHNGNVNESMAGVSRARLLTDADTEAMVQRVQPEDRDEVFSLLLFFFDFLSLSSFLWSGCQFVLILPTTTGQWTPGEAQRTEEEKISKLIPTRGGHSGDSAFVHWSLDPDNSSSEASGTEQQPAAAALKWRAASHRADWGEGGEQHGSLTGAGGGRPPLRYEWRRGGEGGRRLRGSGVSLKFVIELINWSCDNTLKINTYLQIRLEWLCLLSAQMDVFWNQGSGGKTYITKRAKNV